MCSTSAGILLSSVMCAYTHSVDDLVFGGKLVDRAFVTWSLQHGLLEDTMHAKPGAKLAKNPAVLSSEQPAIPTSPLKSPSKRLSPSAVSFSSALGRSPVKRAPGASANQIEVPAVARKEGLLERLARAKAWAGEGLRYLAPFPKRLPEMVETPIHVAGLTPPETPRGRPESLPGSEGPAHLDTDSVLGPFPGVLPELMAPDKAASIHIAGLTPIKESKISDQAKVTPHSHIDLDSIIRDIDSDIMNSPRRRIFLKPPRSQPSDG